MNRPTVASVARIKKQLLQGKLVAAQRNVGKTTALLETAYDLTRTGTHCVVVVAVSGTAARELTKQARKKFPGGFTFDIVAGNLDNFEIGLRPPGTKILVDEFWYNCYQGPFFAGVWTPPFKMADLTEEN